MLTNSPIRHLARDTRGFTLMETLVAMITGVAVTGALFAILEVSMNQSTRLSDVAQATQQGRTAMTHIVDELHSTCLSSAFTPVQEKSNATELIFTNAYSESSEITSERQDKIVWSKATGTLTDNTYVSNGGSWPTFTFPAEPTSSTRIGEHISEAEVESGGKVETLPIFRYYAYSTKSSTTPTAPSTTLNESSPLTVPLSKTEAPKAASVVVSFKAAPNDAKATLGRGVNLTSQVTFAFSAPSSEAPIEAAPCE
jgi:hypothetical protein